MLAELSCDEPPVYPSGVHTVITISRSLGAGAEFAARAVAEELGFSYVDEEIVVRAAEKAGVPAAEVDQVEHSAEFRRRVLSLVSAHPIGPNGHEPSSFPRGAVRYQRLIEDVIRETASLGEVVIVAHAASIPLAGLSGLLRVFVTASSGVRARRLARHPSMTLNDAERAIRDSDRERREYLERFYGIEVEMPTHYDLVINTDVLSTELVSALIVLAATA